MTSASQVLKNGQLLQVLAGSGKVNPNDLIEIGGPGQEAWTAAVADYAATNASGTLVLPTQLVAAALPGPYRQTVARDRLGNIYSIGTNSSGQLVAYQCGPLGVGLISTLLDSAATSINGAHLFQIQSGAYAAVYARASGAIFFVIFDSQLNLVAGPSSVATGNVTGNVSYHSACVLSGGGFAVVWQTPAGTAINLATYSNVGSSVQAPVAVQVLASAPAQQFVKVGQLATGNLVIAYRGTMTAGGIAGTSFTVCGVNGSNVAGPINLDTANTLGFVELSVLPTAFAIAEANGTNLVAGVFSNAGVAQGTPYSVANTNNSVTFSQMKLTNDGTGFWLAWFSSAARGLYVIGLSSAGVVGTSGGPFGGSTLSANTFALDADVVNGLLVAIAASSSTGGQYWLSVMLPDASLGVNAPSLRAAPVSLGSAAATTGSNGPRLIGAGQGLYQGVNAQNGRPANPSNNGDWTVIILYDHQNVASTSLSVVKVEASAILGAAQGAAVPAGNPGSSLTVNCGPGEYILNALGGTQGTAFNHVGLVPAGTGGALYQGGAALNGIAGQASAPSAMPTGSVAAFAGTSLPANGWLQCDGSTKSRTGFSALFAVIGTTFGAGDGSTTFTLPDGRGNVIAGVDTGGIRLGNGDNGGFTGTAALGVQGGEQNHLLTVPEMPAHTHTYDGSIDNPTQPQQGGGARFAPGLISGSTGGSASHNNVQPTLVMYWMIKT